MFSLPSSLPPSFPLSLFLFLCVSLPDLWSGSATWGHSSRTCASETRCIRVSWTWAQLAAVSLCASAPWWRRRERKREREIRRKLVREGVDVWDGAQTGWANQENDKGREIKRASVSERGRETAFWIKMLPWHESFNLTLHSKSPKLFSPTAPGTGCANSHF